MTLFATLLLGLVESNWGPLHRLERGHAECRPGKSDRHPGQRVRRIVHAEVDPRQRDENDEHERDADRDRARDV